MEGGFASLSVTHSVYVAWRRPRKTPTALHGMIGVNIGVNITFIRNV